ncbi:MAG: sulfotransferase family 2 domain-containing protein, partial [Pseudomonadota bacterium]
QVLHGENYRRILFVRHPADRLVSCFLDRIQDPLSIPYRFMARTLGVSEPADITFDAFVSVIAEQDVADMNPHWRPIYNEACCHAVTYDTVLKFEDMPGALSTLLGELYPERIASKVDVETNISPTRTGASSRVKDFVSTDVNQKIARIYANDFEHFGY